MLAPESELCHTVNDQAMAAPLYSNPRSSFDSTTQRSQHAHRQPPQHHLLNHDPLIKPYQRRQSVGDPMATSVSPSTPSTPAPLYIAVPSADYQHQHSINLQESSLLHQLPNVKRPPSARLARAINVTKQLQEQQQQQHNYHLYSHSVIDNESPTAPRKPFFLRRLGRSHMATHAATETCPSQPQLVLQIPLNYTEHSLGSARPDDVSISSLTGASTLTFNSIDNDRSSSINSKTSSIPALKRAFSLGSLPKFKSANNSRGFSYRKTPTVEAAIPPQLYPKVASSPRTERKQTEQFIESLEYAIERAQQLRDQLRKTHRHHQSPSTLVAPVPLSNQGTTAKVAPPASNATILVQGLSRGKDETTVTNAGIHPSTNRSSLQNDESLSWYHTSAYQHQLQRQLCICAPRCSLEVVPPDHQHQHRHPSIVPQQHSAPCPGLVAFMRTRRMEDQQNLRRTRWAAIIYTSLSTTAITLALFFANTMTERVSFTLTYVLGLVVPIYALVDNCSARWRATQTNIALDEQVACVYHI